MAHISEHKKIHLIGIGGCSMSGLACILKNRGYYVQGSDKSESPFTKRLEELGVKVYIGHDEQNLGDCDLVIYSAAIKGDNIERVAAGQRNIPQLERSVALGQLSEGYKDVVGIAGCHGKTTITSMLALMCQNGGPNATVHVGGFVDFLKGGVRLGEHNTFITEACEYVESFLTLRPTIALINNIDDDHLDYYGDIEHIVAAFVKFTNLLPENGVLIANTDDWRVKKLAGESTRRTITYGMKAADYVPSNITYDEEGCPAFDVVLNGETLFNIRLNIPGEHSIINALGAICVARELGAEDGCIINSLAKFENTRRRFEFFGQRNGVKYYHDYGHHPSEIAVTMSAAEKKKHNRLWCVFQCNSYSRAKTLFLNGVTCFNKAHGVLVPDIYPGREKDDGTVHARDMVNAINQSGGKATYLGTFENIRDYLDENAAEGDLVVTIGSGDVYVQTKKLL